MPGLFITVEGIEGVGKTTNLEYLQQLITAAGNSARRSATCCWTRSTRA
jgi:thymidylate kinase